jgi:hypothetical protein
MCVFLYIYAGKSTNDQVMNLLYNATFSILLEDESQTLYFTDCRIRIIFLFGFLLYNNLQGGEMLFEI